MSIERVIFSASWNIGRVARKLAASCSTLWPVAANWPYVFRALIVYGFPSPPASSTATEFSIVIESR